MMIYSRGWMRWISIFVVAYDSFAVVEHIDKFLVLVKNKQQIKREDEEWLPQKEQPAEAKNKK